MISDQIDTSISINLRNQLNCASNREIVHIPRNLQILEHYKIIKWVFGAILHKFRNINKRANKTKMNIPMKMKEIS